MTKKVLVTGSAGFIAPHVIEACSNMGWQVVGIDILETQNQLAKSNITSHVADTHAMANHAKLKLTFLLAKLFFIVCKLFSILLWLSITWFLIVS